MEELLIEYLEDFYENNPKEIEKMLMAIESEQSEWDGEVSAEYEVEMQKIFSKKKKIDLSQWQSDEELTPEQEDEIIANLGRNLPPKKIEIEGKVIGDEEFDDNFGDTQ